MFAAPVLAGYIESQPQNSVGYRAVLSVAQNGCTTDAVAFVGVVVSLGGKDSDALWHISEMTRAGEAKINQDGTFTLTGVFGC